MESLINQIFRPVYPNGIKIIQPSVADGIGYAGGRAENVINSEGVVAGAGDATPLGLGIILADDPG
ncbi:MAG: hypothetical protein ABSC89_16505 [Verrucomicrobiota bacterium]|jgi:hypothetical protein